MGIPTPLALLPWIVLLLFAGRAAGFYLPGVAPADFQRMEPKKVVSEDIGWQHGEMMGSRHNFKCKYCGFTGQGGGVCRLKKHLAGGRLAGYPNVQGCKQVPSEFKKLMVEHLKGVRAETARKKADSDLNARIIAGRERDEDIPDEPEMFAQYAPDPDVQERRARAMSRAEAWEADQRAAHRSSYEGGNYEVGSGRVSGSVAGGGTQPHRYSSVEDYFTRPPVPEQPRQPTQRKRGTGVGIEEVDPQVYSREHGKQTRIEDAYNPQGSRYKIGRTLAKWWHHACMSFNAAESPYYKTAKQRGEVEYDLVDVGFLRDEEDSMVSWVARATTERGEYELDEEADDPEDPPRPNTFLKRAVEEALEEEEREMAQLQRSQSSRPQVRHDDEVDLLGEIQMGGTGGRDKEPVDDDAEFERLMQGPPQPSQSLREPIPRRTLRVERGRERGKEVAQPSQPRQESAPSSRGPRKGIVIQDRQESAQATQVQKKKGWFSGWR